MKNGIWNTHHPPRNGHRISIINEIIIAQNREMFNTPLRSSPNRRKMSHGFEIANAISFKEAGYCWVLGHPELATTVIPDLIRDLLCREMLNQVQHDTASFGVIQLRSA